ncbi:mCG1042652, isoform CRA_b, partial [Mus musculus]
SDSPSDTRSTQVSLRNQRSGRSSKAASTSVTLPSQHHIIGYHQHNYSIIFPEIRAGAQKEETVLFHVP